MPRKADSQPDPGRAAPDPGRAAREPTAISPTARRRRLGIDLKRLREAAGHTAAAAARALGYSEAKMSRLEAGKHAVRPSDVTAMLNYYGVQDDAIRDRMTRLASQSGQRAWWFGISGVSPAWIDAYIGLESEATTISMVECLIVPGLLQTKNYATELFRAGNPLQSPEEIESLVALRLERQKRLESHDRPTLKMVIGEAALRCRVGAPATMREQLLYLAERADVSRVELRVLPFSSPTYAAYGATSFVLLDFSEPDDPGLVYTEQWEDAVILDERAVVGKYRERLRRIVAGSLSVSSTITMLRRAAEGWK